MDYPIIQEQAERVCLQCGDKFESGRSDKVFCCSKCKNEYHNHRHRLYRDIRMRVVTSLNRNYRILTSLILNGYTHIRICDIQSMGFNLNSVTGCYAKKPKSMDLGCYDILYSQSSVKLYNIHRNQLPVAKLPVWDGLDEDD